MAERDKTQQEKTRKAMRARSGSHRAGAEETPHRGDGRSSRSD